MTEEPPEARSRLDEYVARLKSIVPPMEHAALDSRVERLLNDPNAGEEDAISILREEFDPGDKP